jgi:hypothetical protein
MLRIASFTRKQNERRKERWKKIRKVKDKNAGRRG